MSASSKSLLPAIHSLLGEAYAIRKWISGHKQDGVIAGANVHLSSSEVDDTKASPTDPGKTPGEPTVEFLANLLSYV